MKRYRKLFSVCMAVMIFFVNLSINTLNVSASFEVSDDRFEYSVVSGYSMVDDSSIPSGNHFFYSYDSGKAWYCNLQDAITLLANKSYGISLNADNVTALTSGFMNYAFSYTGGAPINNRAVKKNGAVVGYALNTINTCKLVRPDSNSNYTIDSEMNNFIFIYVKDYIDNLPLDYFNVKPLKASVVAGSIIGDSLQKTHYRQILMAHNNVPIFYRVTNGVGEYGITSNPYCYNINGMSLYANSISTFDSFVSLFGITRNSTFDAMSYLTGTTSFNFSCYFIDSNGNNRISGTRYLNIGSNNFTSETSNIASVDLFGNTSNYKITTTASDDLLTVYRSKSIANSIVNNTYAPSYNTSNQTNNYDSSSTNNSVNTTTNETNNSTTTNTNIYNEQSENYTDNSYYNEENNYTIDNSVVTENNTTIINNYYGSSNGGDDSGGGSGGDDDDDTIWDALLKAIVDFFKKIGQLIAALLTGLLELINTVLDAFANINNSFEGIKNFLSSIFSWFPSEIVSLMVIGLGLALIASFITWFKR